MANAVSKRRLLRQSALNKILSTLVRGILHDEIPNEISRTADLRIVFRGAFIFRAGAELSETRGVQQPASGPTAADFTESFHPG